MIRTCLIKPTIGGGGGGGISGFVVFIKYSGIYASVSSAAQVGTNTILFMQWDGTTSDYRTHTVKLNSTGTVLSNERYCYVTAAGVSQDAPIYTAVTAGGKIIVGRSSGAPIIASWFEYDPSNDTYANAKRLGTTTPSDLYSPVAVGGSRIFLAGGYYGGSNPNVQSYLCCYTDAWVKQWTRRLDTGSKISDRAVGLTADSSGNSYFAAMNNGCYTLSKYNSAGTLVWKNQTNSTVLSYLALKEQPSIAVNANYVYFIANTSGSTIGIAIISQTDGSSVAVYNFTVPTGGDVPINSIVADANGDIWASGTCGTIGQDYYPGIVFKITGTTVVAGWRLAGSTGSYSYTGKFCSVLCANGSAVGIRSVGNHPSIAGGAEFGVYTSLPLAGTTGQYTIGGITFEIQSITVTATAATALSTANVTISTTTTAVSETAATMTTATESLLTHIGTAP